MQERLFCLLIGYGFGCLLTAAWLVRLKTGRSVSEFGTGNPGMANVMRIFGFRAGAIVLAGDLLKTAAACLLSCLFFGKASFAGSGLGQLAVLWAGLGAVLGHNYPFWRKLKGGKGVAVTCLAIFLFSPATGLAADIAGMLTVFATGYLPLGAVVITTLFTVLAFLLHGSEAGILALVLALIMLLRHRSGLIRVLQGKEERNAQLFRRRR